MPTLDSYYKKQSVAPSSDFSTSAELRAKLTDETGVGYAVFSDSPEFLGTPTTPTPAAGDNSTTIANTAYVNQYINNKITVSEAEPINPAIGDIWIDTTDV